MTFSNLGLDAAILRAVDEKGYNTPTPIQQQAIPAILQQQDLMAAAQTGTGKTAGFTLPTLQLLSRRPRQRKSPHPRVLVLTPTRELAAQVQDSIHTYGKYLPLRSLVVFGGVNINPQISKLRSGIDILVATPGRLLDLHQQKAVSLKEVEIFVLDEADRMLDMGFIRDIRRILTMLPEQRQNLMFSATFSDEIRSLARGLLNDPVEISVSPRNTSAETVKQTVIPVSKGQKAALLLHLIRSRDLSQALIFSRTKHGANRLVQHLEKNGVPAAAIHGNKSQNHRTRVLAEFKAKELQILVATDIAARGIDINQLPHVINFDLPQVAEDYVHRIGRTGRAGSEGEALSLVCGEEADMLRMIEKVMKKSIPREEISDFAPEESLPDNSRQNDRSGNRSPRQQARGQNQADNGRGNGNNNPTRRRRRTGGGSADQRKRGAQQGF